MNTLFIGGKSNGSFDFHKTKRHFFSGTVVIFIEKRHESLRTAPIANSRQRFPPHSVRLRRFIFKCMKRLALIFILSMQNYRFSPYHSLSLHLKILRTIQ
ncbi:hypothetical protein F2Z85_16150 [Bacteroides fragilis]|uniref:Uncharacterized protein n=2 Tax=Bacteroides fragilis TaxID=817 RepID=D1JPM1_BACFG|nr:hypothetical protein HMPREF0101_01922 [Bacteroides fragilis]BAD49462.1 hypothetical protein BF2712 [Bacteroides fragilis YCH46]KAA4699335.1 hypothetical protein F3B28_11535 [Bacteroides fragilis]KAA4701690.1 hypothetical protein F3B26_13455 [Bacteroides fragilis]KAA4707113.1 hypothetical protein F3B27_13580 [Bacteroides fragilis]